MLLRLLGTALLLVPAAAADIIRDVRAAIAQDRFEAGEVLIENYRAANGITPEMLAALSWLGRGALAAEEFAAAGRYASETYKLSLEELKKRPLDAERHLPIALGAAIEVQAHVLAAERGRAAALEFLQRELTTYRNTSIRTRIQKNFNLLSLEGKQALPLETSLWLGPEPPSFAALIGRPVILYFWAHWCGDCRYQAPILARLKQEYGGRGLAIIGPTQRYGYMARGQDATPEQELRYIEEIRKTHYAELADMPVPVSEENFKNYGASTTPTLVLIDREGIVRLYHPGKMAYEELAPLVDAVAGS